MQRTVILSYRLQNRANNKDVVKKGQENQNAVENTVENKSLAFISDLLLCIVDSYLVVFLPAQFFRK